MHPVMKCEGKKNQVIFPISPSVGSPFHMVYLSATGRREFSDDIEIFHGPGNVSVPFPDQSLHLVIVIL